MLTLPIILKTPRLIMREKVLADAPFFLELNSNPNVVNYTGSSLFNNIKEAEDVILYIQNQYKQNGFGRWLVALKETNEPIGWCGLKFHDDTQEVDLGYRLIESQWGKGYATEAATACLDYGFNILNLKRIIADATKENNASINIFKKLGMSYLKDTYIKNESSVVYELFNPTI